MTDLENLTQTSLHDMGINDLTIDFQYRRLTLQLSIYNEDTRGYDTLKLEFQGIGELNLGPLQLTAQTFEHLDVYSHTVTQRGNAHTIHFALLTGHGQPGTEWSFTFEQVKLS
ncbi:hypothetical protein Q5H92_12710 [Hymenobacter sp. M29]|uniref:Uncharacterized protein n=1 Tax=Hymenobacter mellowenesis TaxID=3063995 RepID=A0ABT9ABK2_9BACT|nr:hypothetical protein [Hymenobacter sp. M29]MDO7847225.1 hypothetical protein [Hymenobacter sp. M29]